MKSTWQRNVKTVIGFDNWTAGSHHFERLVPALEKYGYRLILIHIGSWGHDKGRPTEENIGNLLVRDIAYYRGKSFLDILKLEKPSAVLFLSTRAFAYMAFNRYASFLGIPSCHLYHGLLAVQPFVIGKPAYQFNSSRLFRMACGRVIKNLIRLIPVYCKSLLITKAPLNAWASLIREIFHKYTLKDSVAPLDAKTTIGCVYTSADKGHITTVYQLASENVFTVGNPDLIMFGVQESDLSYGLTRGKVSKEIVYIDTCLLSAAIIFSNASQYCEFLRNTSDVLETFGFTLVVKPHHGHRDNGVLEQLKEFGIELCKQDDFLNRMKSAHAVMTETSTAAMIPALLGLPLLLCQYGKLAGLRYGEALASYTRSRYLTKLTDIAALLDEEEKTLDQQLVYNWIAANSGPMPAEEMPVRVAAAIDDMIGRQ